LDKDKQSFWKIWKRNFGAKNKLSTVVNGFSDESAIANEFASSFGASLDTAPSGNGCVPSTMDVTRRRLDLYRGACLEFDDVITIEVIDRIVSKLGTGKAAGSDGLTAKHLKFCHPIILSSLRMLFSMMVKLQFVPTAFGSGVTIPLLKSSAKHPSANFDDYRGITILPIISKVFEFAILECLSPFIHSSHAQFAFKSGHGCAQAVFSVRKIVDSFSRQGSTVSLCSLDISKGV